VKFYDVKISNFTSLGERAFVDRDEDANPASAAPLFKVVSYTTLCLCLLMHHLNGFVTIVS
jgi:hypothetical protein